MKFHRMISILLTIENQGKVTAKTLADQLEISARTVYRDIDALCEAGIPIVCESGPNGGISLMQGYQAEIKQLGKEDIIYLYLQGMGIKADSKSEIAMKSKVSIQKLDKLISKEGLDVNLLKNRFYIDASPWWEEQKNRNNNDADSIFKAVLESFKLDITYRKVNGETSERTIRPYGIVVKDSEWYLAAYCERSKALRIFKCDRIIKCLLLPEHFLIPDRFDLKTYFKTAAQQFEQECREADQYPVTLKIVPEYRDFLNDVEVYTTEGSADGIIAKVNLYSYEKAVKEYWDILIHTYILEPKELRDYVVDSLNKALNQYRYSKGQ